MYDNSIQAFEADESDQAPERRPTMFTDNDRLHIAIQKSGRLSDQSRELLQDAGLRIQSGGKGRLSARIENFPADLMFVRDDDIPTFVSDGICDFGIVGQNVLEEYGLGQENDGFEVLAWVRDHLPKGAMKLIIASVSTLPSDAARARELGADDYGVKLGKLTDHVDLRRKNECSLANGLL